MFEFELKTGFAAYTRRTVFADRVSGDRSSQTVFGGSTAA
jgi:hypothetical protein